MTSSLRQTPRFSLNKLAEYMSATVSRRRALIIGQMTSPRAMVVNYEHARLAIRRLLRQPDRKPRSWILEGERLRDLASGAVEDFDCRCMLLSAQVLEAFAPHSDALKPVGVVSVSGKMSTEKLTLGGVFVSIAPEIALIEPGTEDRVGSIKFHMAKTVSLNVDGLQYVSTLLYESLTRMDAAPRPSLCFAVDAFSGRIELVPRARRKRLVDLEHACEEIAERWPAILLQQTEKISRRQRND